MREECVVHSVLCYLAVLRWNLNSSTENVHVMHFGGTFTTMYYVGSLSNGLLKLYY